MSTAPCWSCYAKFLRKLKSGRFNFALNEKAYLEQMAMDLDKLARPSKPKQFVLPLEEKKG